MPFANRDFVYSDLSKMFQFRAAIALGEMSFLDILYYVPADIEMSDEVVEHS